MKKIIEFICTIGLILVLAGVAYLNKDNIKTLLQRLNILDSNKNIKLETKNEYYRDYDFEFVQNTTSFSPTCFQDLLNIYYTIINSGQNSFTFYCPRDYSTCIDDVKSIANDQTTLSDINNYVHPYNSFQHIETIYDNYGSITIQIEKSYSESDIKEINDKVDKIMTEVLKEDNTIEENIRSAHDYIIANSKYDSRKSEENETNYKSDIAYGPLLQGYGICGGYTDAMELILEKLKIKSYKISSNNHVWNAIFINDKWLNIDLTWDDPVISDGSETIDHDFFLIDTATLLEKESSEHDFNQNRYSELKQN